VNANEPAADFMIQNENEHGLIGYVALYSMELPRLKALLALVSYSHQSLDQKLLGN
jgi:hypothetical protein